MPSRLMLGFKKSLAGVLCYGVIFSYPSWALFGRMAHAGTEVKPVIPAKDTVDPKKMIEPKRPSSKEVVELEKKPPVRHVAPVKPKPDPKEKPPATLPTATSCEADSFLLKNTQDLPPLNTGTLCGKPSSN